MTHITFYRKYRSQTFSELEGQDHIIQTLSNAIQFNRLAHAYIFSGPRGTGKTSTARILAKALNCRNGQSISPCMTCDLCQKITAGHCLDVIEIDAASNTGVDNIRALNEQVNFTPVEGKYKVYIIDEAHMLSSGAFNALLKTLEEPPAFTVFVLATTESHKIPATILSRCQHLHFRKLKTSEVVHHLQHIAKLENITITEGSLTLIARQSSGCMRDAVSLLDQVYSFKGSDIDEKDVVFMLGGNTFDGLLEFVTHLLQKDSQQSIQFLKNFFLEGGNILQLIQDITQTFKYLVYIHLKLSDRIELDQGRLQKLSAVSQQASFEQLTLWLENIARLESELRWFPNPELLLEIRILSWLNPQTAVAPVQQPVIVRTTAAPQTAQPQQRPVMSEAAPAPRAAMPAPAQQTAPASVAAQTTAPQAPVSQAVPLQKEGSIVEQWEAVIQKIKTQKAPLFSILDKSQVLGIQNNELHIKLRQDFKFFRDKLTESHSKALINQLLSEVFGKPLSLSFGQAAQQSEAPQAQPIQSAPVMPQAMPVAAAPAPAPVAAQSELIRPASAPQQQLSGSQKINHIVALFEGKIV